jgi:hypothetical protein
MCRGQKAHDHETLEADPRAKINALIVIVGLGLIALGIVTTAARIVGTPVQEYARLIPF